MPRRRPLSILSVIPTISGWSPAGREIIRRSRLQEGRIVLPKDQAHIVNVGSVGQPRDGDSRAKYVIWDDRTRELEVRFIPYDVAQTMKKIHARGFPAIYADRLA